MTMPRRRLYVCPACSLLPLLFAIAHQPSRRITMQNTGMQGSTPGATDAADAVAEHATGKLSQLSESAHQTMDRLTHAAWQAASRLGEKTHELWDAQGPAIDKARTYMREHPVATIGVAVVIGLVLARLLTRR